MLASRPWLFFGVGFVEHLDSLRSGDRSKIRWNCCPKRFHHDEILGQDCFFSSLPFFNQPKVQFLLKTQKSNELSENNLPSPPQLPKFKFPLFWASIRWSPEIRMFQSQIVAMQHESTEGGEAITEPEFCNAVLYAVTDYMDAQCWTVRWRVKP